MRRSPESLLWPLVLLTASAGFGGTATAAPPTGVVNVRDDASSRRSGSPAVLRVGDAVPDAAPRTSEKPGVIRTASHDDGGEATGSDVRTAAVSDAATEQGRVRTASAVGGGVVPSSGGYVLRSADAAPVYGVDPDRILGPISETDVPKAYLAARYVLGDGIGFENGYSTFGYFTPILLDETNYILFNNSRLIVSHEGALGGNVGVGYRQLVGRRILGGSLWFDTDESDARNRFNQGGFGLELLGNNFDLLFNAYLPFDTDETVARVDLGDPFFRAHRILYDRVQFNEAALPGADLTVGVPLPGNPWLKTYLGTYAYEPVEGDVQWGFRGRLIANVTQAADVGVTVTDDSLFGTNVYLEVGYKFGSEPRHHGWYRQPAIEQRLYEQVERHNRIAHHSRLASTDTVPAINPRTSLPYFVDHVLNTAAAGGDGTFENPFNSLAAANGSTADIIAVRSGTTSTANPLDGPITLANHTRLLGQGHPHVVVGANRGPFLLPLPTDGPRPFVTAPAGQNVVTLASFNEVSALNVLSPAGGASIAGTGITDFDVNEINTGFAGSTGAGNGIVLANASGTGTIRNVRFDSTNTNAGALGISIQNTGAPPLDVAIENASVIFPVDADPVGLALLASNATINASLANSTFAGGNHAGQIDARNGGTINVTATGGAFDNANQDGLNFEVAANSTVNGTFTGTSFDGNGRNGVRVGVATPALGSTTLRFENVTIDNSGLDGIFLQVGQNGSGPAFIDFDIVDSQVLNSGGRYLTGNFDGNQTTGTVTFENTTVTTPGNFIFSNTNGSSVNAVNLP